MVAVQCLKAADPKREILIVRRPGWHEVPGFSGPVFVCPDGTVIDTPKGVDLELSAAVRVAPEVAVGGTFEGWRRAIEAALSVPGCPHWIIGVVAAFAGPIVALTGLDTCGINLSGMSTSGKSKAQRLAASAWSTPDIRRSGLSQSARATDNAVEALAQRASGTVLALDELAHVSGRMAAKMIYTIAGGVGKRRMSADAAIKDSYAWATFAILSGECSLEEKVKSDGGEWLAGMAVRIVDIDVTDVNRSVDAETLRRIDSIEQHYGHAGPAFVRLLMEHGSHRQAGALRERVLTATRRIAGDGADSATVRAATPFALLLIGGELAKNFCLIPPTTAVGEAIIWAWKCFRQSPDATALDPEVQVIGTVRGWIAERWNVTIKNVDAESGINNREAVAWYDESAIYVPKTRLREAAGNGLRESQVASILGRRGMLAKRTEADRLYVRFIPKVGRVMSYALRRSEFGRSDKTVDPDAYTVHRGGRND
jgi:putative DNA primase/helicase